MSNVQKIPFDFSTQQYFQPIELEVADKCNSITVINTGTTIVFVNGFPLNPTLVAGASGESWAIGGNLGEVINRKQITISLSAVPGTSFWVIQKFYAC